MLGGQSPGPRALGRLQAGILEPAHQVDEYCDIDDLLRSTEVLALTLVELAGAQ